MAESDFGDMILAVTEIESVKHFLADIVKLTVIEKTRVPNQGLSAVAFQLSNGKKLRIIQVPSIAVSTPKHSLEIRISDFNEVVARLFEEYRRIAATSGLRVEEAMADDAIFPSVADDLTTIVTVTVDLGASVIRIAKL